MNILPIILAFYQMFNFYSILFYISPNHYIIFLPSCLPFETAAYLTSCAIPCIIVNDHIYTPCIINIHALTQLFMHIYIGDMHAAQPLGICTYNVHSMHVDFSRHAPRHTIIMNLVYVCSQIKCVYIYIYNDITYDCIY